MPQQYDDDDMTTAVLVLFLAGIFAVFYYFWHQRNNAVPVAEAVPLATPHAVPIPTKQQLRRTSAKTFTSIRDNYSNVHQVQQALRKAGLESSDLIVGIDFTKSNTWQGKKTFGGKCLHALDKESKNPYEKVIYAMGQCLEEFDDDHIIPAFGFGDSVTRDKGIFSINSGGGACHGFEQVLSAYANKAKEVTLSGPTNFAPLISAATRIAQKSKSFHILLIVADGQVTSKRHTIESIVAASEEAPLSIIMVGVGDGGWECMEEFDDELPERKFDNFQFVNFTKSYTGNSENERIANFCRDCLMEVPEQYQIIRKLGLLD
jgi:E3 ubiquitin-protein ligase RGLG